MPKKPNETEGGTVTKEQVEIVEKPKSPQEQALNEILKRLEKPVQPPPIADVVDKAQQAIQQAKRAKTPVKMTWYCTDCGAAHIQLDGADHISVDVQDGEFVNPTTGNPLAASDLSVMKNYAIPKVNRGEGHAVSKNRATLAKMKELK